MATADQPTMRFRAAASLGLLLLLPACLEMEQTIVLSADGSAKQTLKMTMREAAIAEVQKATPAAQLGAAASPTAVFDKDLVERELRGLGIGLSSHTTKKVPGKRSVELEATFPDFATLQKTPLCGSAAEWVLAAGPKPGTAKLTLYLQGKAAWTEARAKAEKMAGTVDPVVADYFKKRVAQIAGLDISFRFEVPGEVLVWTKNLEKTGDREVTARITAQQIQTPEDLVRRLAPRFEVIFDATGCKLPLQ
jgi:hypothetical protein